MPLQKRRALPLLVADRPRKGFAALKWRAEHGDIIAAQRLHDISVKGGTSNTRRHCYTQEEAAAAGRVAGANRRERAAARKGDARAS